MRFCVRVPVLSEQMVVALPMVSQAAKWRIKLLSASIFMVEYAREMVTARGSPSGTATTYMKKRKNNKKERMIIICSSRCAEVGWAE